ncbi:MAG TPA: hypothetical protein PK644_10330, partial [bacterium]|nr:hypothetical protein [bacterium]
VFRAKLMAEKQLKPAYPKTPWEKDVLAYYQDSQGNLYRLLERSGHILLDQKGREVYRRTRGLVRVKTTLALRGWPAYDQDGPIGLDPDWQYCLVPGPREETLLRVKSLTDGVYIRGYREGKGFILLSLSPIKSWKTSGQARMEYLMKTGVFRTFVNGKEVTPERKNEGWLLEAPLEATIVFLTGEAEKPAADGLLGEVDDQGDIVPGKGPELVLEMARGKLLQVPFKVPGEGKSLPGYLAAVPDGVRLVFDYVVEVPSRDSALRLYGYHVPQKYGDGQKALIWINGRLIFETVLPRDEGKLHSWKIPLGEFAGQPVLITIASDPNQNSNCDNMRLSRPYLVSEAAVKQPEHSIIE